MNVVFQDSHLIAINKAPGIGVHKSSLIKDALTLVDMLEKMTGCAVYPIHRLDRPASGIMIFALNKETARYFTPDVWKQDVKKTYLAIVRGFIPPNGEIDYPLASNHKKELGRRQKKIGLPRELKEAFTRYKMLYQSELPLPSTRYPTSRFSLVSVEPETGRFHQIRRHLSRIGYPIIGDTCHGDTRTNTIFNNHFGGIRLMLHCSSIEFKHPFDGDRCFLKAPMPEDMRTVLTAMKIPVGNI